MNNLNLTRAQALSLFRMYLLRLYTAETLDGAHYYRMKCDSILKKLYRAQEISENEYINHDVKVINEFTNKINTLENEL